MQKPFFLILGCDAVNIAFEGDGGVELCEKTEVSLLGGGGIIDRRIRLCLVLSCLVLSCLVLCCIAKSTLQTGSSYSLNCICVHFGTARAAWFGGLGLLSALGRLGGLGGLSELGGLSGVGEFGGLGELGGLGDRKPCCFLEAVASHCEPVKPECEPRWPLLVHESEEACT